MGLEAGGDETALKNGDKITQTQDAVILEKMISQFLYNKAAEEPAAEAPKNGAAAPAATPAESTLSGSTKQDDDALGSNPLDDIN